MNYWRGWMNWPLDEDWKCETCGGRQLVWGLEHGTCRCDQCHTEYRMRDAENKIVSIPICQLKSEFKAPAQKAWEKLQKCIDELDVEMWKSMGVPKEMFA